jgi:rubrerythrin
MADLTPIDEKLAEVLGLAQAAQKATSHVAEMEGAEDFADLLSRMSDEAAETERRTDALIDTLEGKKTAIRDNARETKSEAEEMMGTYLDGEEEALDGFEFLTMAEAGELGHWEIVQTMAQSAGEHEVAELAGWAVDIQQRHFREVREAGLRLAKDEVATSAGG